VIAERRRAAAGFLIAGLAAGFVHSGVASARLCVELFRRPAAAGASASIDEQVAPLKLSAAEIRAAVHRAGWPADADVSLVLGKRHDGADLNATQLHYALSYLLYPRRLWVTPGPPATRHGIAIGLDADVAHAHVERVSDIMLLVTKK
jgi:hypothetical protein